MRWLTLGLGLVACTNAHAQQVRFVLPCEDQLPSYVSAVKALEIQMDIFEQELRRLAVTPVRGPAIAETNGSCRQRLAALEAVIAALQHSRDEMRNQLEAARAAQK